MSKPKGSKPPKDQEVGIRCPSCHCRHAPVSYTRQRRDGIQRVRVCRHCGRKFATFERGGSTDL